MTWQRRHGADISAPLATFNIVFKDINYQRKFPSFVVNKTRFAVRTSRHSEDEPAFISAGEKNRKTLSWVISFCSLLIPWNYNFLTNSKYVFFYLQPHKHNPLALAASFIYHTVKSLICVLGPQQDQYLPCISCNFCFECSDWCWSCRRWCHQ